MGRNACIPVQRAFGGLFSSKSCILKVYTAPCWRTEGFLKTVHRPACMHASWRFKVDDVQCCISSSTSPSSCTQQTSFHPLFSITLTPFCSSNKSSSPATLPKANWHFSTTKSEPTIQPLSSSIPKASMLNMLQKKFLEVASHDGNMSVAAVANSKDGLSFVASDPYTDQSNVPPPVPSLGTNDATGLKHGSDNESPSTFNQLLHQCYYR